MESKKWYASKTLWFNGLAFVLALAVVYGFKDFTPAPEIEPLVNGLVALITLAMPIIGPFINMILRFVTKEPLTVRR